MFETEVREEEDLSANLELDERRGGDVLELDWERVSRREGGEEEGTYAVDFDVLASIPARRVVRDKVVGLLLQPAKLVRVLRVDAPAERVEVRGLDRLELAKVGSAAVEEVDARLVAVPSSELLQHGDKVCDEELVQFERI